MCGIAGIYCFDDEGKKWMPHLQSATDAMQLRGPDAVNVFQQHNIGLGHRRLSIIDTSAAANQPMMGQNGKTVIVFNGEIFNYPDLKNDLLSRGEKFSTTSDTEVLLRLYELEGKSFINKLNGFFAFAIANLETQTMFIARDRYGIKPLVYYYDKHRFVFSSEHKALLNFPIQKLLNTEALVQYLQLNYIVAPQSIFKNVKKLLPGYSLSLENGNVKEEQWYQIPYHTPADETFTGSYPEAQEKFLTVFEQAVKRRLISDVPLGAFLSGGIDSSAVVAMASRHTEHLSTFSIGFKDNPLFDETHYAELVAKKFNTNHTAFSLTQQDMFDDLFSVLDYLDEPFADSSALPVYILSKKTRSKVTVALSGDGADELFGGYLKHVGEFKSRNKQLRENLISVLQPVWKMLPKSRSTKAGNLIRQLHKFSEGMKMNVRERYRRYATFISETEALDLLHSDIRNESKENKWSEILNSITDTGDMNEVLLADMNLVLPNDMLTKVDLMSMANSLEVRVPFLDFELVNFAFSLPANFKIENNNRKKIVQDSFKNILPPELYQRPKRGFEVPLLQWFKTDLKSLINNQYLNDDFIAEQKIFNPEAIRKLKQKLFSANPGDVHAQIWAIIVFQHWWKKYFIQ